MPKGPLSKCLWPNLCNMHRQTLWNTTPPTLLAPFLLLSKTSIVIYKFIFIAIIKTSEISDWSNLVPHHQWSAAVSGPKSSQIASENGNKSAFRLFPRSIWTKESGAAPDSREVIISTQMDVLTKPTTLCEIHLPTFQKVFVQIVKSICPNCKNYLSKLHRIPEKLLLARRLACSKKNKSWIFA